MQTIKVIAVGSDAIQQRAASDASAVQTAVNEQALIDGERILSVYHTAKGEKLYVITEADRSSTCILLPEEY